MIWIGILIGAVIGAPFGFMIASLFIVGGADE